MKGKHWDWPDGGCLSVEVGHRAPRYVEEQWTSYVDAHYDEYVRIGEALIAEEETSQVRTTLWSRVVAALRTLLSGKWRFN